MQMSLQQFEHQIHKIHFFKNPILLLLNKCDLKLVFTFGVLQRYRIISPMYWMTVTLYFRQSFQKLEAENLLLKTTVMPVNDIETVQQIHHLRVQSLP